jgi:carbon monoxide dehydrogenase subunit G
MKLSGTHKFKATSAQVFNAILNPEVLKASTGAQNVSFADANTLLVEISIPLPGLGGPYQVAVNLVRRQDPNYLEFQVVRQGRGGSVNAVAQINITDEADGALLSYNGNAELSGAIAVANNPLGEGVVKNRLSSFFKNLDKAI